VEVWKKVTLAGNSEDEKLRDVEVDGVEANNRCREKFKGL